MLCNPKEGCLDGADEAGVRIVLFCVTSPMHRERFFSWPPAYFCALACALSQLAKDCGQVALVHMCPRRKILIRLFLSFIYVFS